MLFALHIWPLAISLSNHLIFLNAFYVADISTLPRIVEVLGLRVIFKLKNKTKLNLMLIPHKGYIGGAILEEKRYEVQSSSLSLFSIFPFIKDSPIQLEKQHSSPSFPHCGNQTQMF